ncbi:hypothetical protein IFM89_009972 [Coptis chinensis]|uniref:Uncharacterized protein n=1 Tax=Coptis chinensis TaxID=261450 RepID=A0A835HP71_9MAGN|nr:hypothetical protein IFM89_009972 [Coptis chinensis]
MLHYLLLLRHAMVSFFIIHLLFLSVHACNAQHLLVVDEELKGVSSTSSKEVDQMSVHKPSASLKVKHSLAQNIPKQHHNVANGRVVIKVKRVRASKQMLINDNGKLIKNDTEELKGSTKSGRVNHKRRSRHPGFNLDYAPPLTHPPSHN